MTERDAHAPATRVGPSADGGNEPLPIDDGWLDIARRLTDMAKASERHAKEWHRRAREAFRKAGVRNDTEDAPGRKVNRILWNTRPTSAGGGGDIDEIVLHDVTVHVEQMDDRCWWIGVYRDDERFAGNFSCDSRGRMTFSMQEDDLPWDRDDDHERVRNV